MKNLPVKVGGILYTKDALGNVQYLLLKRTPQDGGFRQMITGTLHAGESFVSCLQREIREEVGLNSWYVIGDMIDHFTWNRSNGDLIHEFVYPVYVEQQFEPTLSPDEHEKFMWLSYGEAREKLFTENNKRSLSILSGLLEGNQ